MRERIIARYDNREVVVILGPPCFIGVRTDGRDSIYGPFRSVDEATEYARNSNKRPARGGPENVTHAGGVRGVSGNK